MRVVILGKGLMLANLILGAKDAGAEIVGVFRYEQTSTSRFKLLLQDFFNPSPEVTLIKSLNLNQIRLNTANSELFRKILIDMNVDLMLVGTWKEKITPATFYVPKIATVNVHPSLLPKYRGPNPYMQVILHDEKESGVTLHLMSEDFDAGPILKQEKVIVSPNDTGADLRLRSVRVARGLVTELIKDFEQRALMPVKQDERQASYFPHISGDEMMLDFEYQTSDEISRTIRALHPFMPTYITYRDKFFVVDPDKFKILDYSPAKVGSIVSKDAENASISIVAKDNKIVCFENLKLYKSRGVKKYIQKNVTTLEDLG